MSRVLIVGGASRIGSALGARFRAADWAVLTTTRRPEAVTDDCLPLDLAADLTHWQPPPEVDVAYLCAAVTSLAQCRSDPDGTRRLNVDALWTVARKLLRAGAFVVLPSTNLVFAGTQPCRQSDAPVSPLTEYGRQKAELERLLLAADQPAAVVRLTKVLTPDVPLLQQWAQSLRRGEIIHPFSDMVMAPVTLDLAVDVLRQVGVRGLGGITQLSAEQDITYEAAARRLATALGAPPGLVQPTTASAAGLPPETVPRHTTLDTTRLRDELGLTPSPAENTLDAVFAELLADG